jgi:hypothetical protein
MLAGPFENFGNAPVTVVERYLLFDNAVDMLFPNCPLFLWKRETFNALKPLVHESNASLLVH